MTQHLAQEGLPDWARPRLAGKTIVVAGFDKWAREQWSPIFEREGGAVVKEVTTTLDLLLVSEKGKGATAEKKANQLITRKGASIQVLDVEELRALLRPTREEVLAMLAAGARGIARLAEQWALSGIDLSGSDFRGWKLAKVVMYGNAMALDRCDFRAADLTEANLSGLSGANFEGANLAGANIQKASDCKFAGASLRGAHLWDVPGGDFTAADLSGALIGGDLAGSTFRAARMRGSQTYNGQAPGVVFRDADLVRADLAGNFEGADFAGADLTGASLCARLCKANLAGSKLRHATLCSANLSGADLSGADLGGANLANADLRGARLDGANFAEAVLDGAKLDRGPNVLKRSARSVRALVGGPAEESGVEVARRIAAGPRRIGKPGAAMRALEQVFADCGGLTFKFAIDFPTGPTLIHVACWGAYGGSGRGSGHCNTQSRASSGYCYGLTNILVRDLPPWAHGTFRPESVVARATADKMPAAEVRRRVIAACCELFATAAPTDEELAQRDKAFAVELAELCQRRVTELREGPAAVARWNALAPRERGWPPTYAGADLSGASLEGINLRSLVFEKANFDNANLEGAQLEHCDFRAAKFRRANLRGTNCGEAKFQSGNFSDAALAGCQAAKASFRKAKFADADLSNIDLSGADLCGADLSTANLSGARLDDAKYDAATRFPPGLELPEKMRWAGKGDKPHLLNKLAPPASPVNDLNSFLLALRKTVDAGRLANALKMLKADRFQLFSDVNEDHLLGVVKSQTDPSLVYSCRLAASGAFACCTQKLNPCGGLAGKLCKHLLVLVVGLAKAGRLDLAAVEQWARLSRQQGPALDRDTMAEALIRYKGAEAGEIDWRPTETIPEDYYAL
jgi:uncharacterized protein YjbI with pentapeptide repeats